LSQIPDEISGSLRSMTEEELEETLNASKDDEESDGNLHAQEQHQNEEEDGEEASNEDGIGSRPETGGASGGNEDSLIQSVFLTKSDKDGKPEDQLKLDILQSQLLSSSVNMDLNPSVLPCPTFGATVADFSARGLLGKAFPTLFPYSDGDVTSGDRHTKISITEAGKHYLKYCVDMNEVSLEI
jgi:hypothetical protein